MTRREEKGEINVHGLHLLSSDWLSLAVLWGGLVWIWNDRQTKPVDSRILEIMSMSRAALLSENRPDKPQDFFVIYTMCWFDSALTYQTGQIVKHVGVEPPTVRVCTIQPWQAKIRQCVEVPCGSVGNSAWKTTVSVTWGFYPSACMQRIVTRTLLAWVVTVGIEPLTFSVSVCFFSTRLEAAKKAVKYEYSIIPIMVNITDRIMRLKIKCSWRNTSNKRDHLSKCIFPFRLPSITLQSITLILSVY